MKVVDVKNWFCRYAEVIQEKKSFLTELDSAIGDGDHGTNMARGWKEVQTQLKAFKGGLSECFLLVSRTLISHVGGASGPLYGTAFLRMSMVLKEKEHISVEDWKELLNAGCEGIGQRGGTSGGEKTMYDVWLAVTNEAQQETGDDERSLFSRLSEAARKKVEESKELKALKGRASYLGDRSIGHIDPGSESTALLFETLDQTMSQSNEEKTMRKPKTALLLVSHSEQLAEGTKELISAMARDVPVLTAAGDGVGDWERAPKQLSRLSNRVVRSKCYFSLILEVPK